LPTTHGACRFGPDAGLDTSNIRYSQYGCVWRGSTIGRALDERRFSAGRFVVTQPLEAHHAVEMVIVTVKLELGR